MDSYAEQRLQEIKEKGYDIDLNQLWGRGFHLWKLMFLPSVCAILIYSIPAIIIGLISFSWLYEMTMVEFVEMLFDNPALFSVRVNMITQSTDFMVRTLILTLVGGVIQAPLSPGLIKMCHEVDVHGRINFGIVFKYFTPRYYWKFLVVTVITTLLISGPAILLKQQLGPLSAIANIGWMCIYYLFTALAIPMIVFADASPLKALIDSIKIISKNLLMVGVFLLLGLIFAYSGLILCGIGMLFTIVYIKIAVYLVYKQSIGFEKSDETSDEILASPSSIY